MGAHTGEGEELVIVPEKTHGELGKGVVEVDAGTLMAARHDELLALTDFGRQFPAIADLIRSLQRQVSVDNKLIKGLQERVLALEEMLAARENDGR